jgi:hypothetical protein
MPSSASVRAEQLQAAFGLFQEAVSKDALIVDAYRQTLGAQLLAVAASPLQASFLAWAGNFRRACIGAAPLLPDQPMPADDHLEVSARADALERELQGDLRGAVVMLGGMLFHQRRLEANDIGELEHGPEPSVETLRTVLGTWIKRAAGWGGPIVGWMQDLRDRLEPPTAQSLTERPVKPARIRVSVGELYAGSRCWVTFTDARERPTSLAVDVSSLEGNLMWVTILDENEGEDGAEVVLRLPRVGLAGEWAAVVPRTSMVDVALVGGSFTSADRRGAQGTVSALLAGERAPQ